MSLCYFLKLCIDFIYLFIVLGFELRAYILTHSFFVMGLFFKIGSQKLCPYWLPTMILLISAS
jgi:hypothetical protein